jgi:hypothetical protein
MEIKDYINLWMSSEIIYWKDDFQEIDNLKYIIEEDRDFVKNRIKHIFGKCIGIAEDFLVVLDKRGKIRISPVLIDHIYPSPKFEWNDLVQEVERHTIKGKIEDIIWHQKDREYKYFISVNGKLKSRRYNANELMIIEQI